MLLILLLLLNPRPPVDPPRLWIAPLSTAEEPGAQLLKKSLEAQIRTALRKKPRLRMIGPEEPLLRFKAGEEDPRVERAETLRIQGERLFAAQRWAEARRDLRDALKLYELALPSVHKLEALARCLAWLGSLDLREGEQTRADLRLRHAGLLAGDLSLFEALPEESRASIQRLLKKKRGRRSRLKILSEPPGAQLFIDGVEQGKTPLTIKRAWRNQPLYVVIKHPQAGWAGTRFIPKKRRETLKLQAREWLGEPEVKPLPPGTLIALRQQLAGGDLESEELQEHLKVALLHAPADYLLFSHIQKGEGRLQLKSLLLSPRARSLLQLPDIKLPGSVSGLFVSALSLAQSLDASLDGLAKQATAKPLKRRRPRRARKKRRKHRKGRR